MIFVEFDGTKYGIQFGYELDAINRNNVITRNTICTINLLDNKGDIILLAEGVAWQHPEDIFVKEIGRKIAIRHALSKIDNKTFRTKIWKTYFNRLPKKDRPVCNSEDVRDSAGRIFGEGC